ncbi:MAG: HD domain-containing protein [Phycisphaerales bacterium]|nr:HD domain-containing protein [Phycisphaerales bacterium]
MTDVVGSGSRSSTAPRYIRDLQSGERIDGEIFLLLQKDLRTSNNGSLYIHAVLGDQTGQLLTRMWDASKEFFETLEVGAPLRVRGRVESYKNKPQFILDGATVCEPGEVDVSRFLPTTENDREQMWKRTLEVLRTIRDKHLLALIGQFINDAEFADRYQAAPAARNNHHAYIGGLLEHTLNLLELALLVLPRYPRVNRDLVLTGVFLHDIGKTAELSWTTGFEYTTEGQMLGHIVQAVSWVDQKAAALAQAGTPLDPQTLLSVKHIIVAHHGKYEFGSPRLPATAEAFMVHYLDNLDAKLAMVFNAIDADQNPDSDWTGWTPALENRVFKGAR